jgi:thiol-disulfide isomerase/thioredoxin
MPPLQSSMIPLGTRCPSFDLADPRGFRMSDRDASGRPLLVLFLCNHCPFVKHIRAEVASLGREYAARGVAVAAISANDPVGYPDDAPEKMVAEACEAGYVFPYLFDADQSVARAFDAQCTPDIFLFDAAHRLAYRGQLDDSRPKNGLPVTGRDLRAALDAVLAGRAPAAEQMPSIGCSIKWRVAAG